MARFASVAGGVLAEAGFSLEDVKTKPLLVHNVLGWNGPSFAGVACTPENIARLDPDEPLVKVVIDEISSRNAPADEEAGVAELDDPNVIEGTATTAS